MLGIVSSEEGLDREHIIATWLRVRPPLSSAHAARIPHVVEEVLWRLTNLGWIRLTDRGYTITQLGARASAYTVLGDQAATYVPSDE